MIPIWLNFPMDINHPASNQIIQSAILSLPLQNQLHNSIKPSIKVSQSIAEPIIICQMTTNKRKEQLLSENHHLYLEEEDLPQEIQMANFQAINKNLADYAKLQDQHHPLHNPGDNYLFHPKNKPALNKTHQRVFTDKQVTPITSYNFEPSQIVINGTTFVHVDAIKGQAKSLGKPKKPEMEVQCEHCCTLQMVPANSHSFICFNCDCTQGCNAEWGIFICGSCQKKVWYPLGKSDTIKCTKCWTVNWIPSGQNREHGSSRYDKKMMNDELTEQNEQGNEDYFGQRHPIL